MNLHPTQKQIESDIINISRDYIKNVGTNNLEEVSQYVMIILKEIYSSKYDKYFYTEILDQIISLYFCIYKDDNKFKFNINEKSMSKLRIRVKELILKPQPEQRTEMWYAKRFNSIGASELASIFNKSPFCTYKKYLEKKSDKSKNAPMEFNKYCHHGVKYEFVVQQLYCNRENTDIIDFGSIDHETHTFIAASPDGITSDGTMLEIKCPYSREIIGIPPIYYWHQMQQQLEVCKLNKCDFVECKITEYKSWNDFLIDNYNNDYTKNSFNLEKGCIIEYKNEKNELNYIYPDIFLTTKEDIIKWHSTQKLLIDNDPDKNYINILLWKLEVYSKMSIYRNKIWWKDNISTILEFWSTVTENRIQLRNAPVDVVVPPKKPRKKKEIVYTFLDDSD